MSKSERAARAGAGTGRPKLPGRMVLVLQGGGALGAYQVGVYQALHEAQLESVLGCVAGAGGRASNCSIHYSADRFTGFHVRDQGEAVDLPASHHRRD